FTFRLRTGDGQGPDAYLDRQPYFQKMEHFLIRETGVHWIDTFRYLFGKPVSVYADLRKLNPVIAGEDAGYFLMEFGENRRALFDGNRLIDHDAENCRTTLGEALLEGTKGSVTLKGSGELSFRRFGKQIEDVLLPVREWPGFAGDCVHALQEHVIDSIRNQTTPENTAADYLAVLEIEAALYRSAETGRKIGLL
ncbi:MAG: Gfo/Idh/MocA family oxidoreductase, partial [Pseudomonadota bacterium]